MSNPNVLYRAEEGVAWLTLNRPDRLNAMTNALMRSICDALKQVDEDHFFKLRGNSTESHHGFVVNTGKFVHTRDEHPNLQGQRAWGKKLEPQALRIFG